MNHAASPRFAADLASRPVGGPTDDRAPQIIGSHPSPTPRTQRAPGAPDTYLRGIQLNAATMALEPASFRS